MASESFSRGKHIDNSTNNKTMLVASAGSVGTASYYGSEYHGKKTASGEVYNQYGLTAAHNSYKFGTRVKVTNISTGQSVVVRINDRGPFSGNRVIDLSYGAAKQIGMVNSGVAQVSMQVL
jgi:rare lipoprotein A